MTNRNRIEDENQPNPPFVFLTPNAVRERNRALADITAVYHRTFDETVARGVRGMRTLRDQTGASAAEVHEAICGLALAETLRSVAHVAEAKARSIRAEHGVAGEVAA